MEPNGGSVRQARLVSRRQLLRAGGVLVSAALVEHAVGPLSLLAQAGGTLAGTPTTVLDLIRSDVQLRCTIELYGLEVAGDELVATADPGPRRIVFVMGSQHVDDATPTGGVYGPSPVAFRSAAPSRLAFEVNPPVAFDMDTLLDWQDMALALDGRAALDESSADTALVDPPGTDVTAIELHEGLTVSPIPTVGPIGGFTPGLRLDADPQTFGTTSVTWRARLVGAREQVLDTAPVLRAIWSPGYVTGAVPAAESEPFARPLTALNRRSIVQATGDWSTTARDAYPAHEPIVAADTIQLSPAGATASLSGAWTGPGSLSAWLHDIFLGRTMRATVVRTGYLLPFGHRAAITSTTVRRFTVDTSGGVVAGMTTVEQLVIPRSTVAVDPDLQPFGGRGWPFTSVTLNPPAVTPQGRGQISGESTEEVFLIQDVDGSALGAGTTPVMLTFDAVDRVGQPGITFQCPGVFITADAAFDATTTGPLTAVLAWTTFGPPTDLFTLDFGGQPIAMADSPAPGKEGQVSKQVTSLRMVLLSPPPGVTPEDLRAAGQVGGFPHVVEATVTDPVTDSLRGTAEAQTVFPHPDWLNAGYGPDNVGGSYLKMATPVNLGYQGGGGSLASPELVVEEYNAELGISAPLDDLAAGWNPLENLQISAKLFGAIPLSWVLPDSIPFDGDLGAQVDLPNIGIDLEGDPPTSATFALCWEPPLRTLAIGDSPTFIVSDDLPDPDQDLLDPFAGPTLASFKVSQTVSFTDAADGDAELEVVIQNVVVQLPPLAPLVQLYVREVALTVSATDGEALDVDIADVKFTGILNFLDVLEEFLGGVLGLLPGLGDGESIELYGQINTPAIPLGVFNISSFPVITRLQLPTTDDGITTVELQMGEFRFTILGYGGKGEFHIIAAPHPDGILYLFAELAATVEISVSAIIANAYASCSFGARLEIEQVTGRNPKTGEMETVDEWRVSIFVEISAGLSILGLVSLSGTIELAAEYNITLRVFTGRVTATLAVDYLIGETSKSVTFEESFLVGDFGFGPLTAGGSAAVEEPTFGDRYSEAEWLEYCGKFA